MTRRELIRNAILAGAATAFPGLCASPVLAAVSRPKASGRISIVSLNSGERLDIAYLTPDGAVDPKAMSRLKHLFRCHHTGQIHPISPALIMSLDVLRVSLDEEDRPYTLVCGYRSPQYIKAERRQGGHLAAHSLHAKGLAADIRLPGVRLREVLQTAEALRLGGVGSYPDFVHLDVGSVRTWRG